MTKPGIDLLYKEIIVKIHNDIYKQINEDYVDVFLCGGVSKKGEISIRDKVRDALGKQKKLRILYPEDLFIEILNNDKKSDMLTLERFLANNCDVICIICESAGSLVELGAFTNNVDTVEKVIAVIEEKRKKDKSFIMLGPVKLLKKNSKKKDPVLFYSKNDLDKLYRNLRQNFSTYRINRIKTEKDTNKRSINSIIGLYHFIPLLIYFFEQLEAAQMKQYSYYVFQALNLNKEHFDTLFSSSRKLLFKDKLIQKNIINNKTVYSLTEKGYNEVSKVLYGASIPNRTKLYDNIRLAVLGKKYYKQHRFP